MTTTTSIILDTRRIKRNGKFPLKLRVTNQRITRDYLAIFELNEFDYKRLSGNKVSGELQKVRQTLNEIVFSANSAIKQMEVFDFLKFKLEYIDLNKQFFKINQRKQLAVEQNKIADGFDYSPFLKRFTIFNEDHSKPKAISITFLSYIKKLLEQGRIGSAINYQRTYRSIKAFKGNVLFSDITVSFLYQYENWMLSRGATKTTVGIVLRPLRSIFNEAIEDGIIKRENCYPFGRKKYQIPTSRNLKKALTQEELKQVFFYKSSNEKLMVGKAYWLFCYLANGMNVKDMIFLRWKNIQGEYLIFERSKTDNSNRVNPKPITVYLTEDLLEIIQTHGNINRLPHDFIFPLMQARLNSLEQFDLLNHIRRLINEAMAQIAHELKIEKKITTIVSRHSFSTQLKRSGISTEYIQEALGHSNIKTTENYLDSFPKELKKEFAQRLTSFLKETTLKSDLIE
jgi:integrase/recombinase XerD